MELTGSDGDREKSRELKIQLAGPADPACSLEVGEDRVETVVWGVAVRETGEVGDVVNMCCWGRPGVELELAVPPTLTSPTRSQAALRVVFQSVPLALL